MVNSAFYFLVLPYIGPRAIDDGNEAARSAAVSGTRGSVWGVGGKLPVQEASSASRAYQLSGRRLIKL